MAYGVQRRAPMRSFVLFALLAGGCLPIAPRAEIGPPVREENAPPPPPATPANEKRTLFGVGDGGPELPTLWLERKAGR